MMNVEKRVDWNAVLKNRHMQKASIDFALGLLSRDDFYSYAVFCNVGGQVRKLIRNNGAVKARELTRKALKRRRVLNRHNLTNPLVYAQL